MNIVLGLAMEIASVIFSAALKMNAKYDCLANIASKGYKYDKRLLDKYFEKQKIAEFKVSRANDVKKFLGTVITFIPIVNLLGACVHRANMKRKMVKSPEFNKALIPMSREEMHKFVSLKSQIDALIYVGAITTALNNDDVSYNRDESFIYENIQSDAKVNINEDTDSKNAEEIAANNNDKSDVQVEPEVITYEANDANSSNIRKIHIRHEELLPLGYTVNEIEKLNDALTVKTRGKEVKFGYITGKLNNEYVAIIGIPNLNRDANEKEHLEVMGSIMEELPENSARKYTFSVYPQVIFSEQELECLENAIQEIKQTRYDYDKMFDKAEIDEESDENTNNNSSEQGPTLRKTIKYR